MKGIKNTYWGIRREVRSGIHDGMSMAFNLNVWFRNLPDLFSSRHLRAPEISARACCCIDVASRKVISQKNHNFRYPPASIVKLATALLLVRSGKLLKDEFVTIEASDVAEPIGSSMRLEQGDIVSYVDLLYGMLLASGNDAARATARTIGLQMQHNETANGDPTVLFVAAMNELANSIGMQNTKFCNPSGQDSWGQYSTAHDLAILGSVAFCNPDIKMIISERKHEAKIQGRNSRNIILHSTLDDVERDRVVGGKTGTTKKAKACLAILLEQAANSKQLVIVTLGSKVDTITVPSRRISSFSRYEDMRQVIDHVGTCNEMVARDHE